MVRTRRRDDALFAKLGLCAGFAALLAAVLAAYTQPATSYEPSIYRATPGLYWAGLAIALGTALLVSLFGVAGHRSRGGAFLLAYAGFLSAVALPIIRGYYYVGAGDSMTHLGWVKDVASGVLDPVDLLYPAIHLTSVWTGSLLGVEFRSAIQLVVVLYFGLFLLFVPLCVRAIAHTDRATIVGLFSAGLFLPINSVSVFRMAHSFTQAILFLPLVFYLLFAYLRDGSPDSRRAGTTPFGVLLVLASIALVLVHPQLGVGLVLLFAVLTGLQHAVRTWRPDTAIASHRPLTVPTAVVGAFYVVWVGNKPAVRSSMTSVVDALLGTPTVGAAVAQRAGSATAVGASFEEIAFKLFFVSFVYSAIAAPLMLRSVAGRLRHVTDERNSLVTYLTVGSVPFFVLFAVFMVSGVGRFYFRFQGALMAIVTILGSVALLWGTRAIADRLPRVPVRAIVVVFFAVLVPLSLLTMYFSPYVLRASPHVTEQRMSGYETAFEHREAGVGYVGVRRGVERESHAIYGTERASAVGPFRSSESIPPAVFDSNLSVHYEQDRYLPVTDSSYRIEVEMYRGFRYSRDGFRDLETTPGIDRVQSNGEFRLYRLQNGQAPDEPASIRQPPANPRNRGRRSAGV